jgi:protein tyrosine/serine phosphatase
LDYHGTFMTDSKGSVPFENTYWVVRGQFLAGEHPVELSEDLTQARLTALLDAGVRTFMNLTEEREKMSGYADRLRALAAARGLEITVLPMPIPDRGIPSAELLRTILDAIDGSLADQQPVFVHCFAGVGRTGTVVGCHLKRHGRATAQNVLARIAELRKQMPGGNEASPHTPDQVQLVTHWPAGL